MLILLWTYFFLTFCLFVLFYYLFIIFIWFLFYYYYFVLEGIGALAQAWFIISPFLVLELNDHQYFIGNRSCTCRKKANGSYYLCFYYLLFFIRVILLFYFESSLWAVQVVFNFYMNRRGALIINDFRFIFCFWMGYKILCLPYYDKIVLWHNYFGIRTGCSIYLVNFFFNYLLNLSLLTFLCLSSLSYEAKFLETVFAKSFYMVEHQLLITINFYVTISE